MTLALLLTAVGGAWAEETPLVTIYASSDFTKGSQTFDNKVTATFSGEVYFMTTKGWCGVTTDDKTLTVEPVDGITITRVKFYTTSGNAEDIKAPFEASMNTSVVNISGDSKDRYHVSVNGSMIGAEDNNNYLQKIEVYGTAEPPIVVEPGEAANTWTFNQPGGDVVLTPIYAKAAAFATKDIESVLTLLEPAAAEGVIAGTDAPLIAEGTGVVAFAGTSTTVKQGTLWYAIGTSATTAPDLDGDAWSTTVPTAEEVDVDGEDVYVWYYIKGADAPNGEDATLDNTFDNTVPVCLTVPVRSNKFDLTLKAANANTIDATDASKGSVSVKVGDADAEDKTEDIADGKLKAVKMGSEVKLNTKAGYKFRKVEVKKTVPVSLTDATKEGAVTRIRFNYRGNVYYADFTYSNGSFTRTGGSQGYIFDGSWTMKEENGVLTMTANYNESGSQYINFVCTFYADTNEYTVSDTGFWSYSFSGIEVNGTDITSQLTKVK